jgi:arsenate reductase
MVRRAKRVITMGCAVDSNTCPAILLKGIENWGLPDSKGRPLRQVRAIRNQIKLRIEALLSDMTRS